MVLYYYKMYIKTINGNISKESQNFGAKVVSMFEREFNEVAVAA